MKKVSLAILLMIGLVYAGENPVTEPVWKSLFDGETLTGWTNAKGEEISEKGWVAEAGILTRKSKGAGSLFSAREFGDFELSFEWKISKKGNSGVKYRLVKFEGKWLGLEYQVLDDAGHPDAKNGPIRRTASLYDLKPASEGKILKPIGEWNKGRIVVKDGLVTHHLNGREVMRLEIPSVEWDKRFGKSKYRSHEGFGVNERGRLMLQDHGDEVSYRNLKIREF